MVLCGAIRWPPCARVWFAAAWSSLKIDAEWSIPIQREFAWHIARADNAKRFAAPAKKIARTQGVSFLRFRFQITGCTGVSYAVFRSAARQICFCFVQYGLLGDAVGRGPGRRSHQQHRSSVGVHDDSASSKALASSRSRVSKPSVNQP
jgi:hypothetical protein